MIILAPLTSRLTTNDAILGHWVSSNAYTRYRSLHVTGIQASHKVSVLDIRRQVHRTNDGTHWLSVITAWCVASVSETWRQLSCATCCIVYCSNYVKTMFTYNSIRLKHFLLFTHAVYGCQVSWMDHLRKALIVRCKFFDDFISATYSAYHGLVPVNLAKCRALKFTDLHRVTLIADGSSSHIISTTLQRTLAISSIHVSFQIDFSRRSI